MVIFSKIVKANRGAGKQQEILVKLYKSANTQTSQTRNAKFFIAKRYKKSETER